MFHVEHKAKDAESEGRLSTDKVNQGSSIAGYHFVNGFQDCARRWFFRYQLGIMERYTGKALSFGLAWHKAIEHFYAGEHPDQALDTGIALLVAAQRTNRYQYPEDYTADVARFPVMFKAWVEQIGKRVFERYEVLSLEETLSVELPNGFQFTGRLDELLKDRETGAVVIAEHKSTSYSLTEMERNVFVGDQLVGYAALLQQAKPDLWPLYAGSLLDVTYQRGARIEARLSTLYYAADEVARFLLNMTGVLSELSQKIAAWESGISDALLFPRNGTACSRFRCPYEPICRKFIDGTTDLPDTLVRGEPRAFTPEEDSGV